MKVKAITFMAAAIAACMVCAVPACADEMSYDNMEDGMKTVINGDVNSDGKVNAGDITKIAAHIKGLKKLDDDSAVYGDVNEDGKVNAVDISATAASIKGLRPLNKISSRKDMRTARKLFRNKTYTIRLSSAESEMSISADLPNFIYKSVSNPGKEDQESMICTFKDNKYYVQDPETKQYTLTEAADPSIYNPSELTSVMMGEKYEYMGYKEDEGKSFEIYKSSTGKAYYVYEFDDGVFTNTTRYLSDGSVSVMKVEEFSDKGEVPDPDLEGYTKKG